MTDLPDACIFLDHKDEIVGMNPAAEKLFALLKMQVLGKTWAEICAGMAAYRAPGETEQNDHNQRLGYLDIRVRSLQDLSGKPLGQVAVLRPADAPSYQQALQRQNEMLLALQETAFDLHSSLDLKIVLQNIIARACKLLGTAHGFLDIVTESGKLEPAAAVGSLAEILTGKANLGTGVAGTVWKTGKPLFIPNYDQWPERVSAFPTGQIRAILGIPLVLNGQIMGVIAIARDSESPLSFSEEDIQALQRFADLAVIALQNARLFQQAREEIEFRRKTERDLRNANQVLQFQIERIELLQKQLQEQAIRDSLTNLFNRRYLQETLEMEFARITRSQTSLAILMIDCDRLKYINDIYGHKAGDDALILISNVIRESIRAGDIACRYGGDEFVVVLGNVTQETAIRRAENIRNKVAAGIVLANGEKVEVNITIGVAMFPAHGLKGDILLQRADQALYAAKNRGKNRVMLYNDS